MLRSLRSELINLQIFFALEGLERRFFDDEALEACMSRVRTRSTIAFRVVSVFC